VVDAEDLTQETFCTAQARLAQLREPASARAWLCTILRHHYLKSLRAGPALLAESLDSVVDLAAAGEDEFPDDVDPEALQQALRELPEAFRSAIILFYFEEFSYRDIAEQLGVPLGTVMSRLARGKAHLRARLRSGCVAVRP
jgi:RNA polymerase sigma-70 factor (ECF subfamily)